jgi:hypothetical protein
VVYVWHFFNHISHVCCHDLFIIRHGTVPWPMAAPRPGALRLHPSDPSRRELWHALLGSQFSETLRFHGRVQARNIGNLWLVSSDSHYLYY